MSLNEQLRKKEWRERSAKSLESIAKSLSTIADKISEIRIVEYKEKL